MDTRLIEQIKISRPNLKLATIEKYGSLLKKLNGNKTIMSIYFLKDPKKIVKFMEFKRYKDSTKHLIYIAINVLLCSYTDKNTELIEHYKFEMNKLSRSQKKKIPKQNNCTITLNDLDKIITKYERILKDLNISSLDKIDNYTYKILQKYVIISLIKVYPESNIFIDLHIKKKSDDINYIYKRSDNYYIVHNTRKCKKYDGQIKIKIMSKLSEYIDLLIKHSYDNEYLLTHGFDRKTKLSHPSYTKKVNHIFKTELNINNVSTTVLKYVKSDENKI